MSVATILIVEDNELNMKLTSSVPEACGHETIQLVDGSNFLELVDERRPDLIVMDIQLPVWSGLELTKTLKSIQHLKHIPVIAVTAFAMRGDEQRIRKGGCDDYLAKPFSIPELRDMVSEHLERSTNKNQGSNDNEKRM